MIHINLQRYLHVFLWVIALSTLASCGGSKTVKSDETNAGASSQTQQSKATSNNKGGYYLDDGPGENAPADMDAIPNAVLRTEDYSTRANKPYIALEQKYIPMTSYAPYKKQGMASWYGKRYHGKKTSIGETYDMYAMTAAHTTLPIPSYAKVTNVGNGRSVIVRINDRGPFKNGRLIDLSYAAAYKLRMVEQGGALVEVEAINTSFSALQDRKLSTSTSEAVRENTPAPTKSPTVPLMQEASEDEPQPKKTVTAPAQEASAKMLERGFYLQTGAFKSEANSDLLLKKLENFERAQKVQLVKHYNGGLYRVKVGPYTTRKEADVAAHQIRQQFNLNTVVQEQH